MCPGATTLIARIKDQFKTVEDMETIFKKMDLNCNGKMTKEEMIKAGNFNEQEVDAVFDLGDVDRDGEIDLQEFIGVMQTAAPQAYSQSGEEIEIGKVGVYKVGSGAKCVIWCHDCKGAFFLLHRLLILGNVQATEIETEPGSWRTSSPPPASWSSSPISSLASRSATG